MKEYRIIEKEAQKWLKPINVSYPNDDEHEEYEEMGLEHPFALHDAVLYKRLTAETLYIGNRPVGECVNQSEVQQIRQAFVNGQWERCDEENDWFGYLPVRHVYTDNP